MKFLKIRLLRNQGLKRYIAYAFGELILIVFGVLLALYINNRNSINKYHNQTDNNFKRAALELKDNIDRAKKSINNLHAKDSLIYLVMNDLVTEADYKKNIDLAYLTIYYFKLELQSLAYQNLIRLNTTEDQYKEELITKLKELYALTDPIIEINSRMSLFVYEKSMTVLSDHINSFADLTFKGKAKKDAIKFFTTSRQYKSLVGEYSIIATQNQLRVYLRFLEKAGEVYDMINSEYGLKTDTASLVTRETLEEYSGIFLYELRDTIKVDIVNDSLSVSMGGQLFNLIHINEKRFISTTKSGGAFFSFSEDKEKGILSLIVSLQSSRYLLQKIEEQ